MSWEDQQAFIRKAIAEVRGGEYHSDTPAEDKVMGIVDGVLSVPLAIRDGMSAREIELDSSGQIVPRKRTSVRERRQAITGKLVDNPKGPAYHRGKVVAKAANYAAAAGRFAAKYSQFAGAARPSPNTGLSERVTKPLRKGEVRTPAEVKQARNFFKNHRDAARQWWEQRTGEDWPEDAIHDAHPRPIKDGGDPLFIEPSYKAPWADHMVPRPPDGLTDAQRWGKMGGRPEGQ